MRKKLKDFHDDVIRVMGILKKGRIIDAYEELNDMEYRMGWALKEEADS